LGKARLEIDNVKRQMLQQEIAFNIQQTDALTRLVSSVDGTDICVFILKASQWSLNSEKYCSYCFYYYCCYNHCH
jgi:hypothetical protein